MTQAWHCAVLCVFLLLPKPFQGSAKSRRSWPKAKADPQIAILVGAGDIADCKSLSGAEATAKLLDQIPGTVMAVGDLAYPDGSKENFVCYDKTWGVARSRTRPAPHLILIIVACLRAIPKPAITATSSARGTSLC